VIRMQRKAERLERMKDDPYYIVDNRQSKSIDDDDVDLIPVVRIDDLPLLPKG
jgi:AP-3 complex subunit delta